MDWYRYKELPYNHFVYQTTNLVNGKIYVGVRSTKFINDNYLGSGKALQHAINKYGRENFSREILSFYNTRKEAFEEEAWIVTEEWVKDRNNYNLVLGGEGTPPGTTKYVISEQALGIELTRKMPYYPKRKSADISRRYPNGRPAPPLKGQNNIETNSNKVVNLDTGITYPSLSELARQLGINRSTLDYRIKQKFNNYNYEIIVSPKNKRNNT